MRPSLTIILLVLLPISARASDVVERLDDYFRYCHDHGMLNGAVLVKDDGETVYERAFGFADLRDERPLDTDSAFYLASVSKQLTCMGAMILAEEGALSLDAPLTDFFPEFESFAADVRVHHLMTHTSGIPDHYRLLGAAPTGLDNERVREILLEHGALDFRPGTRFRYSNGGYVLLSMIVGEAAGKGFAEVMDEKVFEPLGMSRTVVIDEHAPPVENRAVGFTAVGDIDDYDLLTTGAGGVYTTVGDLALWDAALHEGRLVSAEMQRRAYTPPSLPDGATTRYGFGWFVDRSDDRTLVFHSGGLAGFATYIIRDLATRDMLVVLSNRGGSIADFDALSEGVARILAGLDADPPPIPIGPLVRRLIHERGVDAALSRYEEIWTGEAARYDLREGYLNELGYEFLQAGDLETALAIFRRNTQSFPDAFNTWDSLAEAQMLLGRDDEAIANYERSLRLNPDNTNAVAMLERLRGDG